MHYHQPDLTLGQRLWHINWSFVLLVTATACIGFGMLYSAANGNIDPWASRQMVRFGAGMVIMLVVAVTNIRFWLRYAYAVYGLALALLLVVEFAGTIGMGAQRWIDLGVFTIQPSELMKIALILALARYFYACRLGLLVRQHLRALLLPSLVIVAPGDDLGVVFLAEGGFPLLHRPQCHRIDGALPFARLGDRDEEGRKRLYLAGRQFDVGVPLGA